MSIYTSLGRRFFPSGVAEQSHLYLSEDQRYDSEGHFAWPAWLIEFTNCLD